MLRRAGLGPEVIAEQLGIAVEAVEEIAPERVAERERLDRLLAAVWPAAQSGDPKAIDQALKIMELRRPAHAAPDDAAAAVGRALIAAARGEIVEEPPQAKRRR